MTDSPMPLDAGLDHPSNPKRLSRETRLAVARKIAVDDPQSMAGWWVAWVDDLRARITGLELEALRYYAADGSFVVMASREAVVAARVAAAKRIADLEAELDAIKRPCSIRRGREVEDIMAHGEQVLCSTFMVAHLFEERTKAEARAFVLRDAAVRAARAFNVWGSDEDGIHPEAMPAVEQLRAVLNLVTDEDLSPYRRRVMDGALADLPAGYYLFRKKLDDAGSHFDAAVMTPEAVDALGDLGVCECALTMTFADCVESLRLEVKP